MNVKQLSALLETAKLPEQALNGIQALYSLLLDTAGSAHLHERNLHVVIEEGGPYITWELIRVLSDRLLLSIKVTVWFADGDLQLQAAIITAFCNDSHGIDSSDYIFLDDFCEMVESEPDEEFESFAARTHLTAKNVHSSLIEVTGISKAIANQLAGITP